MDIAPLKVIAKIHNDFTSKFGIPRQSGMSDELISKIVFEPEYRNKDAVRGLEGYSHIWLIWQFSAIDKKEWAPTVRPPVLGGNKRMGVFATRSPYRPNKIGLSSVKLEKIELSKEEGPVIYVSGADLMNKSPIFDIKPYLPAVDCHNDASGGFTEQIAKKKLRLDIDEFLLEKIPAVKREGLKAILEGDPRPAYHDDTERIYKMGFAGYDIHFKVKEGVITVIGVE